MNKLRLPGFTLLLILIANFIYGQKDTTGEELVEVIITATRKPETSLNLPYSSFVKKKKEMEQELPRTMPEALAGVPGVFVQKTNHGGGSPFIRGLTGNQTLTLIDGIRLNNATFRYGPNQYLNTIDLFTINSIEVVKGSGSVQYGSDALGGVIQVFTKEPQFRDKPELHGNALAKYMTRDMEKTLRGEFEFGMQEFAMIAGYSHKNFGDLWGGDTTGRQSPSGYDENAFDIKMKLNPGRQWTARVVHQSLIQKDVDLYHKMKLEDHTISKMDPQQRHLSYLNLEKSFSSRYFRRFLFTVSDQSTHETRLNQKAGSHILTREKDNVNTKGFTADILNSFSNSWTANTGAEFYFDKVKSFKTTTNISSGNSENSRGLYPDDSRYANLSFYTLHHVKFRNFVVEGGFRHSRFSIAITDTSLGKVRLRPSAFVANGGVLYKVNYQNSLYANYSSGFRAPNIDDMGTLGIVDFRYEIPAYDLKPERSHNFEVGYKLQATKVHTNLSLFYNSLRNMITREKIDGQTVNGYPVYQKFNSEKGFVWGTELEAGFNVTKNLEVTAITSYAFGQNITKDEPMRRIPPLNKRLLVNYQKEKWYAKAEWLNAKKQNRLAQGDKEDTRIPYGGTPGWDVFNLYGGYYWGKALINAGLQNILNEDYRYHGSGINGAGRSAWVAIRFSF